MLTRKQLELLLFINERLKEEGVPPSFEEMKDALEPPVEIRRAPPDRGAGRARLHPPHGQPGAGARSDQAARRPQSLASAAEEARFKPNVIEGSLGRVERHPARRQRRR